MFIEFTFAVPITIECLVIKVATAKRLEGKFRLNIKLSVRICFHSCLSNQGKIFYESYYRVDTQPLFLLQTFSNGSEKRANLMIFRVLCPHITIVCVCGGV